MITVRLAFAAALAALAAVPSTAAANDVFARSWGGIEFSDSDRDEQAGGDTNAISVDPATGGLVSVGRASSSQWAYRYGPDGRQTQRFRLKKSVTAIAVGDDGSVLAGTAAGRVDRYGRDGKARAGFTAEGRVAAIALAPSGFYVATAKALTLHGPAGGKIATLDIPGVRSIEAGPEGRLYVADGAQARVYDSEGRLLRTLPGLDRPDQIGVDGAGRAYVHDASHEGFGVSVFAADGTFLGVTTAGFYDLQSEAKERQGGGALIAVSSPGDVYFTAQNPDILRIPAAVVPTPRFRVDDPTRGVPQFYDTDPIAVSVGKPATFTTNVFRSLSTDLTISLTAPPQLTLAAGVPGTRPVPIPAGKDFASVGWTFTVTRPGRVPVMLFARGKGPDGRPTTQAKKLPVYGVDGPNITIQGAATRPGAKYSLVAIGVDLGATKIKKRDRRDLLEYLSNVFQVETTARIGGKAVEELPFEIGESLTGLCVPFPTRGTPRIAVTATIPATDRFAGARASRTVTPTARPRTALEKECYEAVDLAGLR